MLTSQRKSRFMFLTSFKCLMLEQGWSLTVSISAAVRVFGAARLKYSSAHLSFSLRCELNMDGTEEGGRRRETKEPHYKSLLLNKYVMNPGRERLNLYLFIWCPQTRWLWFFRMKECSQVSPKLKSLQTFLRDKIQIQTFDFSRGSRILYIIQGCPRYHFVVEMVPVGLREAPHCGPVTSPVFNV